MSSKPDGLTCSHPSCFHGPATTSMKNPRSQLVHILIGKSILETLLVGTIAVVVFLKVFPPTFKGWGEHVEQTQSIAGWAVNAAAPWARVEVQLFIDGKLHGSDRKSTRLNSSHLVISYAGCCLPHNKL